MHKFANMNICLFFFVAKCISDFLLLQSTILAKIPICIAVLTNCQMNNNPCANQEFHMLFVSFHLHLPGPLGDV